MSQSKLWPWVRPFMVFALVLSVPPVLYWFGYVQSSVNAAKRQAHATLSAVSAELKGRLAAHDQMAGTAARYKSKPAVLKGYLASVVKPKSTSYETSPPGRLGIDTTRGGLNLYVPSTDGRALRADIPMENLVPWNVVETQFDALLVLSKEGYLVAQDRRLPAQPVGVPVRLTLGNKPLAPKYVFSEASDGKAAGATAAADTKFHSPFDISDQPAVQIAGVDYVVFMQPVRVAVSGLEPGQLTPSAPAIELAVCGLIQKDRLRRQAMELAPQTLILATTLVLLGLFSIPFLKLRFIGEHERMNPRDVWLLAASILCACALITLAIFDVHAMVKLRARFDDGLRQFSRSVDANLARETALAVAELRVATPLLMQTDIFATVEPAEEVALPPTPTESDCVAKPAFVTSGPPTGSILARREFSDYPDFEAVFLTDVCGMQIRKWMARTIPTPSISIANEGYFEPAMTITGGARPFAFATTVAPTSGLALGVYAMPRARNTTEFGPQVATQLRDGLTGIATSMRSVNGVVTALPYQFALVNRRGEVAFHQSLGSFRGERFFDAIVGGSALQAALLAGASDPASYQYRGRWYRMHATDVPALNMTLVTYYDQSIVGRLAARMFVVALVLVLAIVVSILAATMLSVALNSEMALDWAWPSIERTRYYVVGIVLCVASMCILLLVRWALPSVVMTFMIVAPIAVVLWLGSGYAQRWMRAAFERLDARRTRRGPQGTLSPLRRDRTSDSLDNMAVAYKVFAVFALLAFVSFPTWVVFNDAFDVHANAFSESVHRSWVVAYEKWRAESSSHLVRVTEHFGTRACNAQPDVRCSVPDRIYASAQNDARVRQLREALGVYPNCANLLEDGAQCNAGKAAALRLNFTAPVAAFLAGLGRGNPELIDVLNDFGAAERLRSAAPLLQGARLDWPIVAGMILLIGSLCLLVGSIARHVLGISLTGDALLDERMQLKRADGTRWLLLRPSRSTLMPLRRDAVVCDLRALPQPAPLPSPAKGELLLIQHVEQRIQDRGWRDVLRTVLTSAPAGCVVVVSEIDPLHYLTRRAREMEADVAAANAQQRGELEAQLQTLREELAHWASALCAVRKIREHPPEFPTPHANRMDPDIRARLIAECTHSDTLIDIGQRLLARDDIDTYRWADIVGFVLDGAEPLYRVQWHLCSREERLVMIQLAQSGLINPRQIDIVRRLARRALIVLEPRLRLMNKSFELFVRNAEPPERIAQWEQTAASLSWSRLATPLYALAGVIIAILLFTEQGMFTNVLAIATGTAGAIGSLRNVYASVIKPLPLTQAA